jgi:hypothetical protein
MLYCGVKVNAAGAHGRARRLGNLTGLKFPEKIPYAGG